MKEHFVDHRFNLKTLELIDFCNAIIWAYQAQGFTLTLRQLYYQCVARDRIKNDQKEYKRLGQVLSNARLAGLVDWEALEDRTRNLRPPASWESPESLIAACAKQFQLDPWDRQEHRPEVWIEKDALVGVIEPICQKLRVPYFSCRGYTSQSELYAAGKRAAEHINHGQTPVIFHLGDHDPSGIDMTRDISERMEMFAGEPVEIVRLALNRPQIRKYKPPPNPAKDTDARFESYRLLHGNSSWELDALDPTVIADLIEEAVNPLIERGAWSEFEAEEREARDNLRKISDNYDRVIKRLK